MSETPPPLTHTQPPTARHHRLVSVLRTSSDRPGQREATRKSTQPTNITAISRPPIARQPPASDLQPERTERPSHGYPCRRSGNPTSPAPDAGERRTIGPSRSPALGSSIRSPKKADQRMSTHRRSSHSAEKRTHRHRFRRMRLRTRCITSPAPRTEREPSALHTHPPHATTPPPHPAPNKTRGAVRAFHADGPSSSSGYRTSNTGSGPPCRALRPSRRCSRPASGSDGSARPPDCPDAGAPPPRRGV